QSIKQQQLEAVFQYLDEQTCRSKSLLAYFSEHQSGRCGVCDLCLKATKTEDLADILMRKLVEVLADKPLTIDQLVAGLSHGDEHARLEFIRKRLDEGTVKMNGDRLYYLN